MEEYKALVENHVTSLLAENCGQRYSAPPTDEAMTGDVHVNPVVEARPGFESSRREVALEDVPVKLPYFIPKFTCPQCYNSIITSEKELTFHFKCHVPGKTTTPTFKCCYCSTKTPKILQSGEEDATAAVKPSKTTTWAYIKKHNLQVLYR